MADDTSLGSFPKMDPEIVTATLSTSPFVTIEGIFNVRDFGAGYPTSSGSCVKPLHLFRSGEPSRITPTGIEQLRALGIKKVFDLRADSEIQKYKTATPAIEGVEFVRAPILEEALDPVGIAARLKDFAEDESEAAFVKLYSYVLKTGGTALQKVLLHLRDYSDEPCLIHCTAGKDRTGVFAAVILMLLGVPDEQIAADFALTTIGLQPAFPLLAERFMAIPAFRDNWKGTLNLGAARFETMITVTQTIRRDFGGVEKYVEEYVSLGRWDITTIQANTLQAAH